MKKLAAITFGLLFALAASATFLGDPVRILSGGTGLNSLPAAGQILVGNAGGTAYGLQSMSGDATLSSAGALNIPDATVTGKLITGYVSGAGVVAATDTILQAIQKLNGNIAAGSVPDGDKGDITVTASGATWTIDNLVVTNAKIANSTIDLTAKVTGVLPNANTTAASTNTASAIVTRDGSGDFSAGTITAALTGNASTATALAANPSDCGADSFATAIAANGNLTCTSLAPATSAVGASDIDWSLVKNNSGLYTKTLGANTTFTFSNRTAGQTIIVRLTNTASNYTVTWPTIKWAGGVAPVMTVGAKSDVYTFVYDGTDVFGSAVQDMY